MKKLSNSKLMFIAALIFLFTFYINSQSQVVKTGSVQVIISGVVIDEITNQPCQASIEFRSSKGNKVKLNSNAIDGSYSQVLNAGDSYEVVFSGYDIMRKTDNISLESADKTYERVFNFTVKKFAPQAQLFKIEGFNKGSSELTNEAKRIIDDLQEVMKFNRNVYLKIVASDDFKASVKPDKKSKDKSEAKTKKDKKSKKSKSNQESAPSQGSEESASQDDQSGSSSGINSPLVTKRVKSAEAAFESWSRFKERISCQGNPNFSVPNSKQFNMIILVERIEKNVE